MMQRDRVLLVGVVAFSAASWCGCHKRAALESGQSLVSTSASAAAPPSSLELHAHATEAAPVTPGSQARQVEETSPVAADEVTLKLVKRLTAPKGITSTPLFGCSHANFAWGKVFRGFVVDDAGRVWSFRHDKIWNPQPALDAGPPDAAGGIWYQRAELLSMYSPAESSAELPAIVVAKYAALIEPARRGKVSRAPAAVDAGGSGCEAYFWDATRGAYQRVELGSRGDFNVISDAASARALSRWLRGVEHSLAQLPAFGDVPAKRPAHRP